MDTIKFSFWEARLQKERVKFYAKNGQESGRALQLVGGEGESPNPEIAGYRCLSSIDTSEN